MGNHGNHMKAMIIVNESEPAVGTLCDVLSGFGFRSVLQCREDLTNFCRANVFDLFVHLGSSWCLSEQNSSDVDRHIFEEKNLVLSNISSGVPTLGICFGAQVLASALGGDVHRNHSLEIGWSSLNNHSDFPEFEGPWFQWHYDGFVAPIDSRVLAENSYGVQAFAGQRYLGVQFHPEFSLELLLSWLGNGGSEELQREQVCVEELVSRSKVHVDEVKTRLERLLDLFLNSRFE